MICQNCGTYNPDGNAVCSSCGAVIQGPSVQNPQPIAYAPAQMPQPISLTPAQAALKRLGSSSLFLTAAISFAAATLLNFIYSISGYNNNLNVLIYDALHSADLGYLANEFYNSDFASSLSISSIFSLILTCLLAVALFMIYASAKNNYTSINKSAFTIIKVVNIIRMVAIILISVIAIIAVFVITDMLSDSFGGYADEANGYIFGVLFAFICIMAFVVFYIVKINSTVNSARLTVITGQPADKISAFIGVMCYIACISPAISGIRLLSYVLRYGYINFAMLSGSLSYLADAAASIIFGILIFKCRQEQKMISFNGGGVVAQSYYAPAQSPAYRYQPQQPVQQPVQPVQQPVQPVQQPVQPVQPVQQPVASSEQSFCPACGTPQNGDSAFCSKCGTKLK